MNPGTMKHQKDNKTEIKDTNNTQSLVLLTSPQRHLHPNATPCLINTDRPQNSLMSPV